ncbi:MAG: lipoate--protein ligase [Candidatus Bathyarchaeia archaeon]
MNDEWRFIDLGLMDSFDTQAIYEAVGIARSKNLVPDTLILCQPSYKIVCLGYHQEVKKEIDLDYCLKSRIPIVRRMLGGGAVILDSNQQFYQIIAHRSNPSIPYRVEKAYEKLLKAVVLALQKLRIQAEYSAINDVHVNGRKISGNGATVLDEVLILTGNLILDFDYKTMCNVLKVPSEKFKDKLAKSLKERVTTVKDEIGFVPSIEKIKEILKESFEEVLSTKLEKGELVDEERELLEKLRKKYRSNEWLFEIENSHRNLMEKRGVKISGNLRIVEARYKAKGGLIRVLLDIADETITDIMISGDFWFYPKEKLTWLERTLRGVRLDEKILYERIKNFYIEENIESPGTTITDFVSSIMLASKDFGD